METAYDLLLVTTAGGTWLQESMDEDFWRCV